MLGISKYQDRAGMQSPKLCQVPATSVTAVLYGTSFYECCKVCRATASSSMPAWTLHLLQVLQKTNHVQQTSPWVCQIGHLAVVSTLPWSSVSWRPGLLTSLLHPGQGSLALDTLGFLLCSSSHLYKRSLPVTRDRAQESGAGQ